MRESRNSHREHSWFLQHILAHRAGLLGETDERRFLAHMSQCDECRRALEAHEEAESTDKGGTRHLPSGMIACWDKAGRALRGLERAMVRRHLQQCEDCRQDLEALGYEPMLAFIPELELGADRLGDRTEGGEALEVSLTARESESVHHRNVIRIVRKGTPTARDLWLRWAFPAWAVAASAAAIMLFLRPAATDRGALFPTDATMPWVQPSLTRGGSGVSVLRLEEGTSVITLAAVVPSGVPEGSEAAIEVFSPRGRQIARIGVNRDELNRRAVMLPLSQPDGFEAGIYRVVFWKGDPSHSETASEETFFRIEVSDAP